jgi:hypothetical protein
VKPEVKEWTAVYEGMSYHAFSMALGSLGLAVFNLSIGAIASRMPSMAPAHHVQGGHNTQATSAFMENMDWHRLVGSRTSAVQQNLNGREHQVPVLLISLISGAEESLGFQHFSGQASLFQYAFEAKHPAMVVAQYFLIHPYMARTVFLRFRAHLNIHAHDAIL